MPRYSVELSMAMEPLTLHCPLWQPLVEWAAGILGWTGATNELNFLPYYPGQVCYFSPRDAAPQALPSVNGVPVCSQRWHPETLSSNPWQTQWIPKCATHSWVPALSGDERKMERVEAERLLIFNPFYHLRISRCILHVISFFPWELGETDLQGLDSTERRELNALQRKPF